MDIRWSETASAEAIGVLDDVADQSLAYAESVYARIPERLEQLTVDHRSGSVVPEFGRDDLRGPFVYSFRRIYRIADDEIRVFTAIHGSRQLVHEMFGEAEQ